MYVTHLACCDVTLAKPASSADGTEDGADAEVIHLGPMISRLAVPAHYR
jgi:hypothetical protein